MISEGIVNYMLEIIKNGRITPMGTAIILSRQCASGAFNTIWARQILEQLANK